MTDSDHALRNRVARLLELASEARATGRHAVADQFTERAAKLLDQIVRDELAKSPESATNKINRVMMAFRHLASAGTRGCNGKSQHHHIKRFRIAAALTDALDITHAPVFAKHLPDIAAAAVALS